MGISPEGAEPTAIMLKPSTPLDTPQPNNEVGGKKETQLQAEDKPVQLQHLLTRRELITAYIL
jgi:hypothetical protein